MNVPEEKRISNVPMTSTGQFTNAKRRKSEIPEHNNYLLSACNSFVMADLGKGSNLNVIKILY